MSAILAIVSSWFALLVGHYEKQNFVVISSVENAEMFSENDLILQAVQRIF
jgi:hypothetical protein